jgi:uncharacterized protein (TIRG00374 family)
LLVRITASAALLALIVNFVDFGKTLESLGAIKLSYLVIPVILSLLQTALSSYKWKIILSIEGVLIWFLYLFKTYLIGNFVTLFFPSSFGGDVYRIAAVKRKTSDFSLSASSVIFDRATGLYAMLLVAASGSFALLDTKISVALLVIVLVAPFLALLFTHRKLELFFKKRKSRLIKGVGRIISSQRKFILSPNIFAIIFLAIFFQSMAVVINYVYCKALSVEITFFQLWAIIPLIYLTDVIPLSINGIGIRDSAYVFFFTLLGYPAEQALAVSITLISMRYFLGLIGGGLLLREVFLGRKIL